MSDRLMIGAGHVLMPGWTTLDADAATEPDIVAALPPLPPDVIAHGWDMIAMHHVIEHFFQWDADTVLRDCYAALNPGGVLVLEQPNIEVCAKVMLGLIDVPEDRRFRFGILGFFGEQDGSSWMIHRWGYTPDTLTAKVKAAGFERVDVCEAQTHHKERDFRLEAFK